MFKFLKDKLKSAIIKISEGVEKEGKKEEKIVEKPLAENHSDLSNEEKKEEGKDFFTRIKEKFSLKEEEEAKVTEAVKEIPKEEIIEKTNKTAPKKTIKENETAVKDDEKKGFFESIKEKITTTKINEEQFNELFWEMELSLIENNVAVEVIEKIKDDLRKSLVDMPIRRNKVEETVHDALKNSIRQLFLENNIDLIENIKNKTKKPYIIAFFGINGSGKTTSIAKVANLLKKMDISCVLAASDTFRAASIEQLTHHAEKIGIRLIKHNYGSDPAAVAFDAIKHAKAKNIDVVIIDTAGRMHSNTNLIDEMKKIIRVAKPDLKIFVGESITGNDCVEQAKTFNEAVGIDGIILAKADVDEKGGAAISVSYVTKKPILYLGTGQSYNDLEPFSQEKVMKNIGLM